MTLYGAAAAALDEEAGGDSQPPHKSYSRLGLGLLAFVLVAGAAAVGLDLYCPAGYICPFNNSDYVSTSSGKSVASSLSSTECPPGTDPQFQCETAYGYCRAHCSSGIAVPELQERCRNTCSIALGRCCDN